MLRKVQFLTTIAVIGIMQNSLALSSSLQQNDDFLSKQEPTQNGFLQNEASQKNKEVSDSKSQNATRRSSLSVRDDVPQIKSLSSWMTDLKQNPKIGQLKFNQITVPGAHHAGLTYLLPFFESSEFIEAMFERLGLKYILDSKPQDFITYLINTILVPQVYSVEETLVQGGRYLDLRISQDQNDPNQIYLSHSFLSKIRLNDSLAAVNKFLQANPGEIILLDIPVDYDTYGTVGKPVPHYEIDAQIRQYIDSKFILTRDNISQPISSYGGVYFSGFQDNSTLSQLKIKAGWDITESPDPQQVVKNIQNYYESGQYLKQEPIDFDVLKCDPYVTATTNSQIETLVYENLMDSQPLPIDPLIAAKVIPSNLKTSASLTNPLFYDTVYRSDKLLNTVNIIEMDLFDADSAIRAIQLNFYRYF